MDLNRPRTQRRSLLNIYLSIHCYADIAVVNSQLRPYSEETKIESQELFITHITTGKFWYVLFLFSLQMLRQYLPVVSRIPDNPH